MIKKTLTYLTILAITALPVQSISANVESVGMLMSMAQQVQANNEFLHEMTELSSIAGAGSEAEKKVINKSCWVVCRFLQ